MRNFFMILSVLLESSLQIQRYALLIHWHTIMSCFVELSKFLANIIILEEEWKQKEIIMYYPVMQFIVIYASYCC